MVSLNEKAEPVVSVSRLFQTDIRHLSVLSPASWSTTSNSSEFSWRRCLRPWEAKMWVSIHAVIVVIVLILHCSSIHLILSSFSSMWRPVTSSRSCRTSSTASWTISAASLLSGGCICLIHLELRGAATGFPSWFQSLFSSFSFCVVM